MPQISRYSDQQINELMAELMSVLEKQRTSTDLSLIVLGNLVTHLINSQITPAQRCSLADSFANALKASIHQDEAH